MPSLQSRFTARLLFVFCVIAADAFAQFRWEQKLALGASSASAVSINPKNPNTVFAGSERFAVSRDHGETWQTSALPLDAVDVRMIVIHPIDTNTVLIAGSAPGVWKSQDAGQSWRKVVENGSFNGESMVVDPLHPDTLHFASLGEGFYSSFDRGENWFLANDSVRFFCCLAIRPDQPNVLLGGTTIGNGNVSKSTDYGKTWRVVTDRNSQEIPFIAFDPIDPNNVYATVFGNITDDYGVIKSTDGGDTWQPTDLYNLDIWAFTLDPRNPNTLYAGGFFFTAGQIFYSTDRGASWCAIQRGLTPNSNAWMLKASTQQEVFLTIADGGVSAVSKLVRDAAGAPDPPVNLTAMEPGTGNSAVLNWEVARTCSAPLEKFMVYHGTASRVYTDSLDAGLNLTATIANLQDGVASYITVVAIDEDDRRSMPAREIRFTPSSLPKAPQVFATRHGRFSATLRWRANADLDLAGYNLYRGTNAQSGFQKLNAALLNDTSYVDAGLAAGRYFYYVTAVDVTGLESSASALLAHRPITLQKRILLIDETRDGNGSIASPSDAQVDGFYRRLLTDVHFHEHDLRTASVPDDTLGTYSMLIWYSDVGFVNSAVLRTAFLSDYLEAGGKLLFTGWRVLNSFMGGANPKVFGPEDFIAKYFHIDTLWNAGLPEFVAAESFVAPYRTLRIDSARVPIASWNGRLRDAQIFAHDAEAQTIFTFGAHDPQYEFHGRPVGLKYISEDYRVAVLGFPLYFMKEEDAEFTLQTLLSQDFEETSTTVDEHAEPESLPSGFALLPNYPNPFHGATRLRFELPRTGRVAIEIFNVLGARVAQIVERTFTAGRHEVKLEARFETSGIYFYRLTVTENGRVQYRQMRKLLVVR